MSKVYREAGVDVAAGYRAVDLIREAVRSTDTAGVLGEFGGFGGLFAPDLTGMKRPVLVSGTDGVGTKLKLAFSIDKHDTIGIDCVAMCVNDVLCSGALPLFFLDYIACGKLIPEKIASIVSGVADGCRQSGVALIGGETAEMPGIYNGNEYDIAGFCVGVVDLDNRIDGKAIHPGDLIVGLPSSGLHSNGFSLYRKIYPHPSPEWAAELLCPTKIYVKDIRKLRERVTLKGLAHITGGGWIENIPRMLPNGLQAVVDTTAMPVPEIFSKISRDGRIPLREMYNVGNMGLGLAICLSPQDAEKSGCPVIGTVEEGKHGIVLL
ncbi:MAG: phosphoribosylformylglycinamidine cyclo-ligase [Oscillospiraceae bacterium]|nr:phosphoribosylformylglycinamidine cyclo-ligase [Oscillospiraceae bacterium]